MSERFDLHHGGVARLLRSVQDGVVTRRQLLAHGATAKDVERLQRRKDLRSVHRGIYVNHTGELTRAQREWIAVLAAWPAALARESALGQRVGPVVDIAIHPGRKVKVPSWVSVERVTDLDARAHTRALPPRMRVEHAVLDVMIRHLDDDLPSAFAALARATYGRRTTPATVLVALASRTRVPHRATLTSLVEDLRDGACSVLERGYLRLVERAHGLPRGSRQHRSTATGRATDQDVRYDDYDLVVELDGRAFHDTPEARDRDALRDLAELAASGSATVRVTYGLVFADACRTAEWIATVLRQRGWRGALLPCPRCRAA